MLHITRSIAPASFKYFYIPKQNVSNEILTAAVEDLLTYSKIKPPAQHNRHFLGSMRIQLDGYAQFLLCG